MASGFHGSSVPEGNGLAYIYRGGVCRQIEKENGEVVFSLTPSEFEARNRKITTADELFELWNVDIPDRDPSSYGPGFPLRLKDKPNNIRTVSKYSSKAIELYNDNHGTNYKFVKLKGRNNVFVAGVVLYITFEAADKDRYGGQCKTFNAEMFHRVLSKPEIMSCDLQCT